MKPEVESLIDLLLEGSSLDKLMQDALAPNQEIGQIRPDEYELQEVGPFKIYLKKELTDEHKAVTQKILQLPKFDEGLSYVMITEVGFDHQRSSFIAMAIGQKDGLMESVYGKGLNGMFGGLLPYVFPKGSEHAKFLKALASRFD